MCKKEIFLDIHTSTIFKNVLLTMDKLLLLNVFLILMSVIAICCALFIGHTQDKQIKKYLPYEGLLLSFIINSLNGYNIIILKWL